MTAEQFKEARQKLGLSVAQLSDILNTEPRSVRRWEDGTRPPNPIACRVLEWLGAGFRPDQFPESRKLPVSERP